MLKGRVGDGLRNSKDKKIYILLKTASRVSSYRGYQFLLISLNIPLMDTFCQLVKYKIVFRFILFILLFVRIIYFRESVFKKVIFFIEEVWCLLITFLCPIRRIPATCLSGQYGTDGAKACQNSWFFSKKQQI